MGKQKCAVFWEPINRFFVLCDNFAKKNETILFWSMGILYKLAMDAVYLWAASPRAAYTGLILSPNGWKYLLAWALHLVLFYLLPRREKDNMAFLLHVQYMYIVVPMLTFYAFANGSSAYMLMVFSCILLQICCLRRPILKKAPVSITNIQKPMTVILVVLVVISLIIPILYNGFEGLKAFDFTYVHKMRADDTFPPGFEYLFAWMQKTIVPFAILYCLHRKKYAFAALCMLIQIVFYMESGWKVTLLVLLPMIAIYLLSKTGHLIKMMYAGVSVVFLVIVILYQRYLANNAESLGYSLCSLIPVRAFFIPACIKFKFYGYFQVLPHTYFSDGMIGKLLGLTYPYAASLGQVAYACGGGEFLAANANTGYLGDAYAQMGFVGMLLMSLLLVAFLRILQHYENSKNYRFLMALFTTYIITLNDAALFTTLLTGGLMVALFLIAIYFDKSSEELNCEYSIVDLIQKLVNKWWIILIGACAFCGVSVLLSRLSYHCANAQQAELLSQESPVYELAQVILRESLLPPSMLNVMITSFFFGVIVMCLSVLLATFMNDAAKNRG